MSTLPRPPGATDTDPPLVPVTVNLADPDAAKRWGADLRVQIDHLIAMGYDAAAPAAARMRDHRTARDQITDAARAIESFFAAAGFPKLDSVRSTVVRMMVDNATEEPREDETRSEIDVIRSAVLDAADAHDDDERADVLEGMPLAGVLFLAMVGSPGERAGVDSLLVLALRAVRATIDGWARVRSGSTLLASVPFAALDLLGRRVEAAIEIARRGGALRACATEAAS